MRIGIQHGIFVHDTARLARFVITTIGLDRRTQFKRVGDGAVTPVMSFAVPEKLFAGYKRGCSPSPALRQC